MNSAHIKLLDRGWNTKPLLAALQANPQLWDEHTERTASADSPHHGLSDIWARFADAATMREDGSHESIWYPCANIIPVRPLVHHLMACVRGERLGGVLITRIPPGAMCKPHTDPGWHARYYDKYALQVQATEAQAFHFEDGSLVTYPGDLYSFDNAHTHWVTNDSKVDRITLIVCIRTERSTPCHGEP